MIPGHFKIFLFSLFFALGNFSSSGTLVAFPQEASRPSKTSPLLEKLKALPGVEIDEKKPSVHFTETYEVRLSQPLNHHDPDGVQMLQRIFLSHVDFSRPVVFITEGYAVRGRSAPVQELSELLKANQIRVEHRYFGQSVPDSMLWEHLNIRQAAADHHRIVTLFKKIYPGRWISTGWSKGGQTALFHRRFYPEDVTATVAYDTPLNFSLEDPRIDAFFETVGTEFCREKLIGFQREVLLRKDKMLPLFRADAEKKHRSFSIGEEKAFEYVVLEYPFSFWQYHTFDCDSIPDYPATDQELFEHLKKIVSFSSYADPSMNSPAMFQFSTELGYYGYVTKNVRDLLRFKEYPNSAYAPQVAGSNFKPEVMSDIDDWLQKNGERILYIYAEFDPWSAPAVSVPEGLDAIKMIKDRGNHFTFMKTFPQEKQEIMLSALERWLQIEIER
jgi:hypothetical protein